MRNLIIKSTVDDSLLEIGNNYDETFKNVGSVCHEDDVVFMGISDSFGESFTSLTIQQAKQLIEELNRIISIFDDTYNKNTIKVKVELDGVNDIEKTIKELQGKLSNLKINMKSNFIKKRMRFMYTQEQKIDAFSIVKEIITKYNLDISDKEINDWINNIDASDDTTISQVMKKERRKSLKNINDILGTNFDLDSSLYNILGEMAKQWNDL